MTITAAADGSALGNPGPAGWAWYVDDDRWAAGGWPHGTNNQGELMAVIDLFESTAENKAEELHVLCDSQYVINAVTKWMPGWKRKGWRKADGSPVLNIELITRLDAALVGRKFRLEWVKGHAGHSLNEAADDRARAAALAYQGRKPVPSGPGWQRNRLSTSNRSPGRKDESRQAESAALFEIDASEQSEDSLDNFVTLERRLLDPSRHTDVAEVAALLHRDFEEIGTAGQLWNRESVTQSLRYELVPTMNLYSVSEIGKDTILLLYRITDEAESALYSSLWVRESGVWKARFRQGTLEQP